MTEITNKKCSCDAAAPVVDITRSYLGHYRSLTRTGSIGTASANSVESEHGCTSRIYFDNAGDNVTLTLYNVTLTSQKTCKHNNKCDWLK